MEQLVGLLLSLVNQIGPISTLIQKMQSEGRTTLTPAEWQSIDSAYDAAHLDAVQALAEARAKRT